MGEVKSCGMEQINKELFLSHKKKADEGSKKIPEKQMEKLSHVQKVFLLICRCLFTGH